MDKIIFAVVGIVVGLLIGFIIGMIYRKKVAEREIGSAELPRTKSIDPAQNTTRKSKSAALS